MKSLRTWYLRQQHAPGAAGVLLNPFYFARRGLLCAIEALAPQVRGRVLDVGCGTRPYERLFAATQYVGLELDTPANRARARADVFYDGTTFPFDTASFDAVVCNQVLEHVFEPRHFLAELQRVLRPGGVLLVTVPFVWDEHEQPRDFARYSSFGLRALLETAGFAVLEQHKTAADLRALAQLVNAWLYKITRSGNARLDLFAALLLMAPVNLLGLLLYRLLPANPDLYLDNVALARRLP